MASDLWFYAFFFAWGSLCLVIYHAYLRKIILFLRNRSMYLHYHFIDTGDYGDRVFCEGTNIIYNKPYMYVKDCINNRTLFYKSDEVEPVKVERDLTKYKYFCFTKEFDIQNKSDVLKMLLVLAIENKLIVLLVIAIAVSIIAAVANAYISITSSQEILKTIQALPPPTLPPGE